MRHSSPRLLTLLACLTLLLSVCGLGVIGCAFAPEEAAHSLEESELSESEPVLVRAARVRARAASHRVRSEADPSAPAPAARESLLRGAPPRDAWERPRRC